MNIDFCTALANISDFRVIFNYIQHLLLFVQCLRFG